MSETCPTT